MACLFWWIVFVFVVVWLFFIGFVLIFFVFFNWLIYFYFEREHEVGLAGVCGGSDKSRSKENMIKYYKEYPAFSVSQDANVSHIASYFFVS